MNAPADYNDEPEHAGVFALLPWHAAGRLDGAETARVQRHLDRCAACRAELAWQRELHATAAGMDSAAAGPDMEAALARLLPRLDERPAALGWHRKLLSELTAWLNRGPLVPAAFAAALLALAVVMAPDRPGDYHVLGPVPEGAGDTTVVFRPDTPAADVRRILDGSGAAAVHGPTVAGAYVLSIGPAHRADVLARLRAEPAVLMAEPLDTEVPP